MFKISRGVEGEEMGPIQIFELPGAFDPLGAIVWVSDGAAQVGGAARASLIHVDEVVGVRQVSHEHRHNAGLLHCGSPGSAGQEEDALGVLGPRGGLSGQDDGDRGAVGVVPVPGHRDRGALHLGARQGIGAGELRGVASPPVELGQGYVGGDVEGDVGRCVRSGVRYEVDHD